MKGNVDITWYSHLWSGVGGDSCTAQLCLFYIAQFPYLCVKISLVPGQKEFEGASVFIHLFKDTNCFGLVRKQRETDESIHKWNYTD